MLNPPRLIEIEEDINLMLVSDGTDIPDRQDIEDEFEEVYHPDCQWCGDWGCKRCR